MDHPLLDDPFAARAIDEALRDLTAALDPVDRQWARQQLARLLEEDPTLADAFQGARPRSVAVSGRRPLASRDPDEGAGAAGG